jgi:MoaA/NifB/PqqE/SkfB family radical SAM enzyme
MRVIPDIPLKYTRFPDNYVNDINGWAFDKETIINNKGKLLTLDIDYGSYCSLNCPACFRKKNSIDDVKHELQFDNLVDVILQAKKLGLRSVKFLGAGDPFENFGFMKFLRFLKEQDVIPLIFTKGHVIGDDNLVFKYFGEYGIYTGVELVKELNRCNVSIMLGFNSFDDEIQAKMVGRKADYIHVRNKALQLLVAEGFNDCNPTRLALAINPVTIWNIDETFEMYQWGRLRNLYCIVTPSMIAGRAKDKTWASITPSEEKLEKLYSDIYSFNIETNLQTIEQIEEEGISSYAGGHPCNQVATGMYVSLNGQVLSCPGSEENHEGNYWEKSLEEIWFSSENYKRSGTFNCGCIAKDGKSIPDNFYTKVLTNLKKSHGVNLYATTY